MFTIKKIFYFEAGHILSSHDGKCRFPHGHSYAVEVYLQSNQLQQQGPKKGMVIDFGDISSIVDPMIEEFFDHKWLNDSLKTDTPTAEFIAKWVYDYLKPFLPDLLSITISETSRSSVTYTKTE